MRSWFPRFTPEAMEANQPFIALLGRIAKRNEATSAQVALAWLLAQKLFIVPIPGTRKSHRLEENMGAVNIELTPDDLREEAMLDYCRCRPTDMTAIYETLNRDSQAGTHLSRETLEQQERVITELELEELHWHLRRHAFIHEADFEVPNTLK